MVRSRPPGGMRLRHPRAKKALWDDAPWPWIPLSNQRACSGTVVWASLGRCRSHSAEPADHLKGRGCGSKLDLFWIQRTFSSSSWEPRQPVSAAVSSVCCSQHSLRNQVQEHPSQPCNLFTWIVSENLYNEGNYTHGHRWWWQHTPVLAGGGGESWDHAGSWPGMGSPAHAWGTALVRREWSGHERSTHFTQGSDTWFCTQSSDSQSVVPELHCLLGTY